VTLIKKAYAQVVTFWDITSLSPPSTQVFSW